MAAQSTGFGKSDMGKSDMGRSAGTKALRRLAWLSMWPVCLASAMTCFRYKPKKKTFWCELSLLMRELKYKIKQTGGEPLDGDPYVILITDLIQEFETNS